MQLFNRNNNNFRCYSTEMADLRKDLEYVCRLPEVLTVGMFRVDLSEVRRSLKEMVQKQIAVLQKSTRASF